MKIRLLILFVLFFGSTDIFAAFQCKALLTQQNMGKPEYTFQNNEASHNQSQMIRDNHLDWSFFAKGYESVVRKARPELLKSLKIFSAFKGWCSGDNHSGNYVVTLIKNKMQYFFFDTKDGGYGPLFYNISNLVMNTHAVAKKSEMKIAEVADPLIAAYKKGLKGEKFPVPKIISEALKVTPAEYNEMINADVARFIVEGDGDKYITKSGRLNAQATMPLDTYDGNPVRVKEDIRQYLTSLGIATRVLDIAVRPKNSGPNEGQLRFWALIETPTGEKQIFEFKERDPEDEKAAKKPNTVSIDGGIFKAEMRPKETKFKDGKTEPLETLRGNTAALRQQISRLIGETGAVDKILDIAVRPKERGGSKELIRVWVLAEMKNGDTRIIELKEEGIPAAQAIENSGMSQRDHKQMVMDLYFPQDADIIKLVSFNGGVYTMRMRKVELISVPYGQKTEQDRQDLMDLATYAAYTTGQKHKLGSAYISDYVKAIEANPEDFQLLIRSIVKDYYAHLDEKLSE